MPRQPQTPASESDPLITPAEFARLCGHKDTTTITHWVAGTRGRPDDWPEPDEWVQLPTRQRPMWRRSRAQAFAATQRTRGPAAGEFHGTRHRQQPDPRAADVARWLADAEAGNRSPVTRQEIEQHYDVPDHLARRILRRARIQRETGES